METDLLEAQLRAYLARGLTPLHMPGHKRRCAPAPGLPYEWDLTEVPGTDDLHDPTGILRDAMARTAAYFGAARTWYLVNGSTCGLLAGIRALAPAGGTLIAARNCHKAVFHAVELCGLSVRWLLPPLAGDFGVFGSVPPAAVAAALDACPGARGVVLTSPTYEGVLSDIAAIAEICHARGVPLLVDEAHGAHLGLPCAADFPAGALQGGADLVVQSAHKTLPSLTQTALLHWQGTLVDPEEVSRQLDIFETSSPSYPLLASLDGCTGLLRAEGGERFAAWARRLRAFSEAARGLRVLRLLQKTPEIFALDPSKLLISGRRAGVSGAYLAEALRTRFRLEPEMACGENVLAMTSPCDGGEVYGALLSALRTLDGECAPAAAAAPPPAPLPGPAEYSLAEALRLPAEEVPAAEAAGRIAAETVLAYPPGVPLAVPGERLGAEFLRAAAALEASGTRLRHDRAKNGGFWCLTVDKPPMDCVN